jgi:outer membrane immunogenic protein
MKKLVLTLTALAAFTGSASAADLAARPYSKAPAPIVAPVYNWTGFWISGGFGYGMSQYQTSVVQVPPGVTVFDPGHDTGGKGWLGKVGLGYDYQFAGNFVIGAFADAQWSNIRGNNSFTCPGVCSGPTQGYFTGQINNDWSWAAGGRIGYVALPGLLTYFNGGYTQADIKQVNYFDATTGLPGGVVMGSRRMGGYFLGGGTEYAVSFLPGLFWKNEVRFSDFGNRNDTQICAVALSCSPAGSLHSVDRNHFREQMATTELVYRFNWGGPVAGRY